MILRALSRVGPSLSYSSLLVRSSVPSTSRCLASKPSSMEEARFSKSAAFQGRRGRGAGVIGEAVTFDYYSTDEFGNRKLLSAVLSITALIVYFGWLREANDLDDILNAPPHLLTANLERRMLRQQISEAEAKGQSTELLQAQLEYVDVKEAALKIQFDKKEKQKKYM